MTSPSPGLLTVVLNMAKIGTIPSPYGGTGASGAMKGAVINGDAVFFTDTDTNGSFFNPHGFYAVRVRKTNFAYCDYSYVPLGGAPYFQDNGYGCQQVGPNQLQVFDNGTNKILQFSIPSTPAYGTRLKVTSALPDIPFPCASNQLTSTYYDAANHLVAFEFINGFPEAYNDYAAIYQYTGEILQQAGSGFIGNFPNGTPGFNQTNAIVPSDINTSTSQTNNTNNINYSNGWNSYTSIWFTNNWHLGAYQTRIVLDNSQQHALNCNNPNPWNYVTTGATFTWPAAQIQTIPGYAIMNPGGGYNYTANSYCEVPGVFLCGGSFFYNGQFFQPGILMWSQFLIVQFVYGNYGTQFSSIVVMKDGTIIALAPINGGWDVYQGHINFNQFQFFPSTFQMQQFGGLANYHRAVSPSGSFQA